MWHHRAALNSCCGVPVPLELLSSQSSGGWMLPSRRAYGLLLRVEQWGKASYAAGSMPVLRNGVGQMKKLWEKVPRLRSSRDVEEKIRHLFSKILASRT